MAGVAFDDCRAAALGVPIGAKLDGRRNLAALDFMNGSLVLTEADEASRVAVCRVWRRGAALDGSGRN